MKDALLDAMPLDEKAAFVQKKGQLIEGQDFYSFFTLIYSLERQHIKLLYDFSGILVSVETIEENTEDSFISHQLQSSLE